MSFKLKFLDLQLLLLDLECKESKVIALFATVCGSGRLAEKSCMWRFVMTDSGRTWVNLFCLFGISNCSKQRNVKLKA